MLMNEKTCFFLGNQDAPEELLDVLTETVEKYIEQFHVVSFVVGHYGNFDRLASTAVKAAKRRHDAVTLTMLLPYHPAERPIPLPDGFDGSLYPAGMEQVPRRLAILQANRYMIARADHLIVYSRGIAGNTFNMLKYARARAKRGELTIENLADDAAFPPSP